MLRAGLLGHEAMVGVGGGKRLDDRGLAGVIDLGDEVIGLLLRDAHAFNVQRGAVDDGAGGARGPDGHVEHGVQG